MINGGFIFFRLIPSIPFFDEITIAPKLSASIILIPVPDPNFNGTHKHLEKNKKLYKSLFDTIPLLITHGYFF